MEPLTLPVKRTPPPQHAHILGSDDYADSDEEDGAHAPPAVSKEGAQAALKEAVQVLSAYRQQKLFEVLANYVNGTWPVSLIDLGSL